MIPAAFSVHENNDVKGGSILSPQRIVQLRSYEEVTCLTTPYSGPAKDTFVVGAAVKKGAEDGQNKAYCQV